MCTKLVLVLMQKMVNLLGLLWNTNKSTFVCSLHSGCIHKILLQNFKDKRYASVISQISYTCEQNKNWFHAECEAPFLLFFLFCLFFFFLLFSFLRKKNKVLNINKWYMVKIKHFVLSYVAYLAIYKNIKNRAQISRNMFLLRYYCWKQYNAFVNTIREWK